MKALSVGIFIFLIVFCSNVHAQQTFFEEASDSLTRFFFDSNYYLVDKDCEFHAIERVAKFNKQTNAFDGEFKDFDVATARTILTGNYNNGKKSGVFRAYHDNGKLRWETTMLDDIPVGPWKYYYPDGRPHLYITLTEDSFTIDQMWDSDGKQTVIDGQGDYSWDTPIPEFTEHGYTYYNRSGKVVNGLPDGSWPAVLFNPGGQKVTVGAEVLSAGRLTSVSHFKEFRISYGSLRALADLPFLPTDFFPRAEYLLAKECTFDRFTDFDTFLATKFSRYLDR